MTDEEIRGYFTLLLVVVGWGVVNYQHNKREDRKEARGMIDRAKETAVDCTELAIEDLVKGSSANAVKIKAQIDAIEVELGRLPNFVADSPMMRRFVEFADTLTGGDFESVSRSKRGFSSKEVGAALRARNRLLEEMERQFKAYYR